MINKRPTSKPPSNARLLSSLIQAFAGLSDADRRTASLASARMEKCFYALYERGFTREELRGIERGVTIAVHRFSKRVR